MKYVYISSSILTEAKQWEELESFLTDTNISFKKHLPADIYNPKKLEKAEYLLVFDTRHGTIGKGTYSEILRAKQLGIQTYIIYKRSIDNSFNLYLLEQVRIIENSSNWNNFAKIEFGDNVSKVVTHIQSRCKILEENIIQEINVSDFDTVFRNFIDKEQGKEQLILLL